MKKPYVIEEVEVAIDDHNYYLCMKIKDKQEIRFKCGKCLRGNIGAEFWVDFLHPCKVCGAVPKRVDYFYLGEPKDWRNLKSWHL